MKKVISYSLAIVALLVVLAGCSKPPALEMKAANDAIVAAQAAEAEMYVPATFRQAKDSLNAADKSKKEQDGKSALSRDYNLAKAKYIAAEKLAKKSSTDAAGAKQQVQAEVAKMLADGKLALEKAQADLKKVKVNKKNKADIDGITADMTAAQDSYARATADNGGGKFMDAKQKLNGIMAMAGAVPDRIANAGKAPAKPAPAAKPTTTKPAPKKAPKK